MIPTLKGFDHMHVYVSDRASAEIWYADIMGLKRMDAFTSWTEDGGPLTLSDPTDKIHLALFECASFEPATIIAFGASGQQFLHWKTHLEAKGLTLRLSDHDMAYSLYFHDPDKNMYEITTYETEVVRAILT